MIVSLSKWIERFKFIVLFLVLTFVIYKAVSLFTLWMEPVHRYKQPSGSAVKVFHSDDGSLEEESMPDRLKLFYWYGE